jgi:hypothetical protein
VVILNVEIRNSAVITCSSEWCVEVVNKSIQVSVTAISGSEVFSSLRTSRPFRKENSDPASWNWSNIPVMAIQNDPKYYPEPEKFDPELFTEEKKQGRPNYTYFPFGEGPRSCQLKLEYIFQ